MYANGAICTLRSSTVFHMYRREHLDRLSFEDFFLPFGGELSGDSRWIKLAERHKPEQLFAAAGLKSLGGQLAVRAWGCETKPSPRGSRCPTEC
jgi:hypothetical protein